MYRVLGRFVRGFRTTEAWVNNVDTRYWPDIAGVQVWQSYGSKPIIDENNNKALL